MIELNSQKSDNNYNLWNVNTAGPDMSLNKSPTVINCTYGFYTMIKIVIMPYEKIIVVS